MNIIRPHALRLNDVRMRMPPGRGPPLLNRNNAFRVINPMPWPRPPPPAPEVESETVNAPFTSTFTNAGQARRNARRNVVGLQDYEKEKKAMMNAAIVQAIKTGGNLHDAKNLIENEISEAGGSKRLQNEAVQEFFRLIRLMNEPSI
jgi:hypothetical protein